MSFRSSNRKRSGFIRAPRPAADTPWPQRFFAGVLWRWGHRLVLVGVASALLGLSGAWLYISPGLPDVERLRDVRLQTPLQVYSRDGQLMGEFGEKRRKPIRYDRIPPLLLQAVLAAEDDRFPFHSGIDISGLVRSAIDFILSGEIRRGGSTITMQVARNYFLTRERILSRKLNEIFLALKIERDLNKAEILELYVNKIYLGKRAYGFAAAAEVYYGKPLDGLSLAQMAMLAGLPKAPSRYNSVVNPERAVERRNWILRRMRDLGMIDELVHASATADPVTARYHVAKMDLDAPYVAEMARQWMVERFGARSYREGLKAYTTIDSRLQRRARWSVLMGVLDYDARHGYRGPEGNLQAAGSLALGADADDARRLREYRLGRLRATPSVAIWRAAAVVDVAERAFTALLDSGQRVDIAWDRGLSAARPQINQNRRGLAPKRARDVVSEGDLVRLALDRDGRWRLSQLPEVQSALVALDPADGAVLSLVGGVSFHRSAFNRAAQAKRQSGSVFKPLIYTAALHHGFDAHSVLHDAPVVLEDESLETTWRPSNYSGYFVGELSLREALYRSRNLASVRLLQRLTIPVASRYVSRFGLRAASLPKDLSLSLGSHAMTPLEVVRAYAVFANGGYLVTPYIVGRVQSMDDATLVYRAAPQRVPDSGPARAGARAAESTVPLTEEGEGGLALSLRALPDDDAERRRPPAAAEQVIDPRDAYIMDSILQDVIRRGTGSRAKALGREDLAGKTGTTNGPTDLWFAGYHPELVAVSWVGFDDNRSAGGRESGASAALPVWIDFMEEALAGVPAAKRRLLDGLVTARSGRRGDEPAFEIFRRERAAGVAADPAGPRAPPGAGESSAASAQGAFEELF